MAIPRISPALVALLLTLTPALALPAPLSAQIPETFTNLQVLPEDIPRDSLIQVMRGFALQLGVRCTHCHLSQQEAGDLANRFAPDEKPAKEKARFMVRMVERLNREVLPEIDDREGVEVGCQTCHRKRPLPWLLEGELRAALETGGSDAAVRRYEALRERFYGRGTFDFDGPWELNEITDRLAREGRLEAAVALQEVNVRYHPEDPTAPFALGEYHLAAGNEEAAREAYTRSLELDPDNPRARARLEALGVGGAG